MDFGRGLVPKLPGTTQAVKAERVSCLPSNEEVFGFFPPQIYHFAASKDFVSMEGQMSFPNPASSYHQAQESSQQQGFLHPTAPSWAVGDAEHPMGSGLGKS